MSDYEVSDSEDDYDENEKILLENVRKRHQNTQDESEEEIFNVGADEETDDDEIELAKSDVEGQDDESYLPNPEAWGKDSKQYFSSDYVRLDYDGYNEKDIEQAEFEEQGALQTWTQLLEDEGDDDFDFGKNLSHQGEDQEITKLSSKKSSRSDKIDSNKTELIEFMGFMQEYKGKIGIYRKYLHPIIEKFKNGQIGKSPAMEFVQTFSELILNYCSNIFMFVLLRSHGTSIQHHPIRKRLSQYFKLLKKLEPVFEDVIKPQVMDILADEANSETKEQMPTRKKKLKILDVCEPVLKKKKKNKKTIDNSLKEPAAKKEIDDTEENKPIETEEDVQESEEKDNQKLEKRAITYQIAKNKGLTPHRKKEQRNPRVKHRNKFKKAKVRRKGAVREVRNELTRYGGEISGIKANVTKSIKIKS